MRVEVLTDRPEDRFTAGRVVHAEGGEAPLTIAWAAPVQDGPGWRLRFNEVPDRAAADRLRDRYLEVDADPTTELAPGAAYWHEVVGSKVRGDGGRLLGTVTEIYRAGENEVYVVSGGPVGEFDLPAVRTVIADFAPGRGEIVVDESALNLAAGATDPPKAAARHRPRWSRHGKGARSGEGDSSSGSATSSDEPAADDSGKAPE